LRAHREINVLCFGKKEQLASLHWVFEQNYSEDYKAIFFQDSIANIKNLDVKEFDFCLFLFDLNQPVPVENLKKINSLPALACFVQPTQRQLLDLNELDEWKSFLWAGNDFENLAHKFYDEIKRQEKKIKEVQFLNYCKEWILENSKNSSVLEFVAFLKQAGLEGETSHNEEQLKSANRVFGYCQKLLVKSMRGELKIVSKNCEGTLFFHDGAIVSAITGGVSGEKAFYRILSWEGKLKFSFQKDAHLSHEQNLHFTLADLLVLLPQWSKIWKDVKNKVPPYEIDLQVDSKAFVQKQNWEAEEFVVVTTLGEHTKVRDVMNFCPLPDHKIVKNLIGLRKKGIIFPKTNT